MTAKLQREVKVEGLGEVYKVEAPFDQSLASILVQDLAFVQSPA